MGGQRDRSEDESLSSRRLRRRPAPSLLEGFLTEDMAYSSWTGANLTNSDSESASDTEEKNGNGLGGLTDLSLGVGPSPVGKKQQQKQILSELEQHYERNVRPLLDTVDRLRTLGITMEGIQLPSIVVVGDQSSGKSSVLESLASINLPRGSGISTRVPLILRLQRCPANEPPSVTIELPDGKKRLISEEEIKAAVDGATIAIAGDGKGVKDTAISLHIRKPTAPDLTMIDLPGITRVPVHGQPDDIYEQIAAMIHKYIKSKESVILNVLSATVDFSTCESIRMSQKEDKEGRRTLAVVTKVDIAPHGLYEKVTVDAVNIGLGYICVRNRADNVESHEEAREKERTLFQSHPALSKFGRDIVGIDSLAERLTNIQADIIRTSLPGIVRKIEKALHERRKELSLLPEGVTDELGAEHAFLRILMDSKAVLEKLVVQGKFEGYSDDLDMHYTARLHEYFTSFNNVLYVSGRTLQTKEKTKEIMNLMVEGRGVYLSNFPTPTVFDELVREQIGQVTYHCQQLVDQVYNYAQQVVITVIDKHAGAFANMKSSYGRSAKLVLAKTRDECMAFVNRTLDKECSIVFTMNDYYMETIRKIREQKANQEKRNSTQEKTIPTQQSTPFPSSIPNSTSSFVFPPSTLPPSTFSPATTNMVPQPIPFNFNSGSSQPANAFKKSASGAFTALPGNSSASNGSTAESEFILEDDSNEQQKLFTSGEMSIASNDYQAALEMRVNLVAYWKVVHKRLVDGITHELKYAFQLAILKQLDKNILKEKASKGATFLLTEDQALAKKRIRLKQSLKVLQEGYKTVCDLMKW